ATLHPVHGAVAGRAEHAAAVAAGVRRPARARAARAGLRAGQRAELRPARGRAAFPFLRKPMARKIFVNLPIKDMKRSQAFFRALGFSFNPQFTNEQGACMVISEDIFAML